MLTIAAQLQILLERALGKLTPPVAGSDLASVTPAADGRFGDYQTNAAMVLAKQRRANPRALATEIVAALGADPELAQVSLAPEIAGAGFINFRLTPQFLSQRLALLAADAERLGVPRLGDSRKVVIDFSSPNIAKPMHVGHLRSTIIGDCLARVGRYLGFTVVTDNHIGDWGTQFGKIIYGWKRAEAGDPAAFHQALAADPLAELVRLYQETSQSVEAEKKSLDEAWPKDDARSNGPREYTADSATVASRLELTKLQQGEPDNLAIWQRCVDLSSAANDAIYEQLRLGRPGQPFDHQFGESFFQNKLAPLVENLAARGIAQPSEGALVAFFPDDPKLAERPAIIRKRDGAFNYATTDIATYEQRVEEFQATDLWYVVGAPQALHFEQLNAIVRRMGYTVPLTHIPFGSILGPDRKIMRTRSGDNVALGDLLAEAVERARAIVEEKNAALPPEDKAEIARIIGLGAVKYAELSQHRLTDYIFNWDKMLSFQGNTAPYLQNAYVRIRSIFRRGELDPETDFGGRGQELSLTEPAERTLALKLAQFAEIVPGVLEDFRPNLLANYLFELAGDFHSFFEACPVLKGAEGAQRETRLTLCGVTARVLRRGLDLLGIEVPERM